MGWVFFFLPLASAYLKLNTLPMYQGKVLYPTTI